MSRLVDRGGIHRCNSTYLCKYDYSSGYNVGRRSRTWLSPKCNLISDTQIEDVWDKSARPADSSLDDEVDHPRQKEALDPKCAPDTGVGGVTVGAGTERGPYSNHSGDPEPLPKGATNKSHTARAMVLRDYNPHLSVAEKKTKLAVELLWRSFLTKFRARTILNLPRAVLLECLDLPTERGCSYQRTDPVRWQNTKVMYCRDPSSGSDRRTV